jgi:Carbohydrate family 9 binding domain-like/FlgD Ig-like domain
MNQFKQVIIHQTGIVFFRALVCSYAALPTYTCKMTKETIQIDGVLNEKTWSQADTLKFVENTAGGQPLQATNAFAAWDSTNLYLAYVTKDNNMKGTLTKRDDPIYNEESVECFFDADTDQTTYIELEWNCLNTVWDGLIKNVNGTVTSTDNAWNASDMVSAVKLRGTPNNSSDVDTGMTVEVKIPWKNLDTNMTEKVSLPPKNNEKMRINFYRIDRRDNVSTPDLYAWSPTMNGSFHTPAKFGYIVFSTAVPARALPQRGNPALSNASNALFVNAIETSPGLTRISYVVPSWSEVHLKICTVSGQTVKVLENGCQPSGPHEIVWNCHDETGDLAKDGAYAVCLEVGDFKKACVLPMIRK